MAEVVEYKEEFVLDIEDILSSEGKNNIQFGFWVKVFSVKVIRASQVVSALRKGWNIHEDVEFTDLEDEVLLV